jgi:hypothetical protein
MARSGGGNISWVQRQMGVYQQFRYNRQRATWIFLHAPPSVRDQLRELLQPQPENPAGRNAYEFPMLPHSFVLSIAAREWQSYMDHLESQLDSLVSESFPPQPCILSGVFCVSLPVAIRQDEKGSFTRVGSERDDRFTVSSADLQQLQRLQKKLLRAEAVLDGGLDVTRCCAAHCRKLEKLGWIRAEALALQSDEFELLEGQLNAHRAGLRRLMRQAQGVKDLMGLIVSQVLEHTLPFILSFWSLVQLANY